MVHQCFELLGSEDYFMIPMDERQGSRGRLVTVYFNYSLPPHHVIHYCKKQAVFIAPLIMSEGHNNG